jgi:Flp pilus assembly protein TadB
MTPTSPIRRRGSQPQALLPRRRSRDRTRPWRRALWWRAGRSRSPGRSASVERTEHRRVVGTRTRRGTADDRVAPGLAVPAVRATRRVGVAPGLAVTRVPSVRAGRREMEAAVPEVIDVLRATVAAGINPRRALQAAAEGAPPALEPVLRRAIQAAELGSGAGRALATAAGAERLTELALAGEALDLAESTGAPPGPVLAGVAVAAADRIRTRQARLAATAQARLSARVVAAMAPAFLGVLSLTAPGEAAFLIREPLGWATLAAALTFELLGVAWSAHIIRDPSP